MRKQQVKINKERDQWVVILDYTTGTVWYRKLPKNTNVTEAWLNHFGLSEDECSWIILDEEPELNYLESLNLDHC